MNRIQLRWPASPLYRLISFAALVAASGCGERMPYACVPVSGKVTYEDGSLIPAEQINVTFVSQLPPIDPKTPPRNGHAEADGKTGAFDYATTFVHKDGIIVGEHKVIIQCISKNKLLRNLVAAEYSELDKTPLKVDSAHLPLELKVPKPR
jgi:hypothetical protein